MSVTMPEREDTEAFCDAMCPEDIDTLLQAQMTRMELKKSVLQTNNFPYSDRVRALKTLREAAEKAIAMERLSYDSSPLEIAIKIVEPMFGEGSLGEKTIDQLKQNAAAREAKAARTQGSGTHTGDLRNQGSSKIQIG